jgi:hypothetical protein
LIFYLISITYCYLLGNRIINYTASSPNKKMEQAIQAFRSQQISVLVPGQAEYRHAIATSNLLYRFSRPDCVVEPETPSHVQTIIKEAVARSIKVTIKCNGHSYAGHSTAFSGISLDLRKMNGAKLDMNSRMVTMDSGCQWGAVYEKLVIGRHDGYIINGGRCPTVGVSGFTLGAGLGPFTRSFGMGADTLAEATLVTADGSLITVGESDPPTSDKGRLFWALRGAGGGNFGVVVQMKLHVQKLRNLQGTVVAGKYLWCPPSGFTDDVVATMNTFYRTPWPKELTIDTNWICDLRLPAPQGIRFLVYFDGNKVEYDRLINTHIINPELQTQLKRRVLQEKSTRFLYETLNSLWFEEIERAYPKNASFELYSSFVFTKSSDFAKITAIIYERMTYFRKKFNGEQVNFQVTWIHSGGKASEFQSTDTAFYWREALFNAYVTIEWIDKWMELDMRLFLANVKKELRPLSLNGKAAFMNFADRDFPTKLHEERYYGDNKTRLREVKDKWDPNNFFKWVHGVRRTRDPEEDDTAEEYAEQTDKLAKEQWAGMF